LSPVAPRSPRRRPAVPRALPLRPGSAPPRATPRAPSWHDKCPTGRRPVPALPKIPFTPTPRKPRGGPPERSTLFLLRQRASPSTCEAAASRASPRSLLGRALLFVASAPAMDAYSKDMPRGVGGGDDGEKKVRRSESGTEEVDLTLELSLGGRLGAKRRRVEGLAGSSSVAVAPPAPVGTNSSQGAGFPPHGVAVEPSALLRATLNPFLGSACAAEVQPSATPLRSIKMEPVEGRWKIKVKSGCELAAWMGNRQPQPRKQLLAHYFFFGKEAKFMY
uniref:Uncharacterized protein n=2 Tax=Aegilops tauschii subsp. strangulata TaxID=200361 RepID=A0A453INH5_AEGTS